MSTRDKSLGWLSILAYHTLDTLGLCGLDRFLLQTNGLLQQSLIHCQLLADQLVRVLFHHLGCLELLVGLAVNQLNQSNLQ